MNVYSPKDMSSYEVIVRNRKTNKTRSRTIHTDGGLDEAAVWVFDQITGGNSQLTPCESNEKNTTGLPREASEIDSPPSAPTPGSLSIKLKESVLSQARHANGSPRISKGNSIS